ncbi:MAG: glycosyltransferase family 9 protein, partial [Candidatus Omnitrophica bacterium]|nr:glycosyltransferase family 9 protein [Candidatus Omnitrophota bacterium]
ASNRRYKEFCLKYMEIDGFACIDSSFFLPLFMGDKEKNVSSFFENLDIVISYTDEEEVFSQALKDTFRGKIIFHPVNPENIKKHITEHLLEPVYNITSNVCKSPSLKVMHIKQKEFFIIHPGSGSPHKNWDIERFLEVYKRLSSSIKGIILLGYAEKKQYEFWYKNISSSCVAEPVEIEDIISYIERAYFYIGNDSGVSHLFAAAGVPSIVIFGPTSPSIWSPTGKNVKILYKGERCSPCNIEQRQLCKQKSCLNSITADDVIKAKEEIWKKI